VKTKLVHPLWSHIPALIVLIILIVYIIVSSPLPEEAPVQFTTGGMPGRIGSPWESLGITLGISVLFLVIAVILDELWARQEKKKSFNWVSLLDELIIGAMTGINIGYLSYLNGNTQQFNFPWGWLFLFAGGAILLAIIFEIWRPYRAYVRQLVVEENRELKAELKQRLSDNSTFVYWDSQNPPYVTILTTVLPVVMFITGIVSWVVQPFVSIIVFVVGISLILPLGGQRVIINRQNLTIRWGIIGLKVLNLEIRSITSAELREFSPLKDFGGYGIRQNREMKAYYLSGSRAVKLETASDKKYLIGSDHPENLATVINTIISKQPGS
jgi:hypothetical protein